MIAALVAIVLLLAVLTSFVIVSAYYRNQGTA